MKIPYLIKYYFYIIKRYIKINKLYFFIKIVIVLINNKLNFKNIIYKNNVADNVSSINKNYKFVII